MSHVRRLWRSAVPLTVRRAVRRPVVGTRTKHQMLSGRAGPGETGGLERVHVGCGPNNLMADWWNVDIRAFPGIDQVADVTQPWPWRGIDHVYGEHFLEHLTLDQAIRFLSEAATALRPGGRIRLSTPSLEWIWRTHFDPSGPAPDVVESTYRANRAFYGWGHQFLWSRPMLEHVLTGAGFTDLTYHDYGESDDAVLRGIERHGGFSVIDRWPSVWIVEATPGGSNVATALVAEAERELERHRRAGH